MALLQNFFCCDLRRAGLVVGWMGIVGSIIKLLALITTPKEYYISLKPTDVDADKYYHVLLLITIGVILFLGFLILISSMLVWGTHRGKRFFLLPWLITHGILVAILIPAILFVGSLCLSDTRSEDVGIRLFLIYLPVSALHAYFWLCILSLYQKMRDEDIGRSPKQDEENSPHFLTVDSEIPYKKI